MRTYSFVATFAVIIVIIGASYYQTLPTVEHIPDTFVFNSQEWMPYVPSDAEFVGYLNYKQAYSVSGNSSLFGESALIQLPQLGFSIIPVDITYEVTIQLPEPKYSGSATLLQVSAVKETSLLQGLASANLTKVRPPLIYDGYALYGLLMKEIGDVSSTLGYLAVVNHHILLSDDKTTGLQNVQEILDQISSSGRSLFDNVTVRRSIYAAGVTDQRYVALFVGRFPTQLNDTVMATKSIIGSGGSIQVSRALLFPSMDIALQRLNQAHQVYRNADTYRILDSFLVVTYNYPATKIQTEIVGI
ncbi:MAG: hypothetical protein ACLP9D_15580 [Candidatus Bathyarchaeia archaeon]